jgi:hypothetical protein
MDQSEKRLDGRNLTEKMVYKIPSGVKKSILKIFG